MGDRIIVGEEISTKDGEIIGLYLKETIPGGIGIDEAIASIKHQGGFVYVPHPFETFRKGLRQMTMDQIAEDIDIIETFNGRGRFRGKPALSEQFAINNNLPQAASSDAHGAGGLGHTSSTITEFPTQKTLKKLLSDAILDKTYAPFYTFFYPMYNRIKNTIILVREN